MWWWLATVKSVERPIATPTEALALWARSHPVPDHRTYRSLGRLRRGEIAGLRVADVDLTEHTITVRKNRVESLHAPAATHDKGPKSEAGKRTITIPPHVVPPHPAAHGGARGQGSPVRQARGFSTAGQHPLPSIRTCPNKIGIELAFHDLRHMGQTLAA